MTPDRLESLRADFEAACLRLPVRPNLDRLDSGDYRLTFTRAMWTGWMLAHAYYCDGEATGPGVENET